MARSTISEPPVVTTSILFPAVLSRVTVRASRASETVTTWLAVMVTSSPVVGTPAPPHVEERPQSPD
jgi:hypothetical protein